ncbi:MAG: hypothetical protein CFE30_12920 [Bradyrhizobium sp. PARBB1]|nr:MAG: hypothetical protein CFE30_12920 [Bradyrhizobium sp. PARBB1]
MGQNRRVGNGRFNAGLGARAGGTGFAAAGLILVTLVDGQTLVLAADEFTIAADGTVVLADAAVQEIATLLGIEATNLGLTLVPLAGAGGLGLAMAGGGGGGGSTSNTPATVGGSRTGAVTEDSAATLTATAKLTVTDPDAGEAVFRPATTRGTYGDFTIAADGTWTYSASSAQTPIQQLAAGKTLTDSAIVFTADGTQQTLTVTLTGVNDAAVVAGDLKAGVTEDTAEVLRTSGKLTVTDADLGQAGFLPTVQGGQSAGYLGTFNFKADGTWTYEVANALVQELGQGVTKTETFTVTTLDGTTQTVTVVITGANDAPTVSGVDAATMEEHGAGNSASGALTVLDTDKGEAVFTAETDIAASYGTASIDADGNWSYTLSDPVQGVPNLLPGGTAEDRFMVKTADGTEHEVVVTITGAPATNEVSLSTFDTATDVPAGLFRAAAAVVQQTDGFVINGIAEFDQSGYIVTSVGDMNGDGLEDVVVSQFSGGGSIGNSDESYVVFGRTGYSPVELSDVVLGDAGYMISGDGGETRDMTISKLGDINGDGLADVLVGVTRGTFYSEAQGTAYVIFGKAESGTIKLADIELGKGGFAISGISTESNSITVAGGGDVNGDGMNDFVVGVTRITIDAAPSEPEPVTAFGPGAVPPPAGGTAFVVFGGPRGEETPNLNNYPGDMDGGFKIISTTAVDGFASSIAIVGDVNGDGLDDIAIGAPGTDYGEVANVGMVAVVYGKADNHTLNVGDIAENGGGFIITSTRQDERLGSSVAAAGDVNGDGLADVFIGAGEVDKGRTKDTKADIAVEPDVDPADPGSETVDLAYVVLGSTSKEPIGEVGQTSDSADPVSGDADTLDDDYDGSRVIAIAGPDGSQRWTISGAGDFDGDGIDDLIVSVYKVQDRQSGEVKQTDDTSANVPAAAPPPVQVTYVLSGGAHLAAAAGFGPAFVLDDQLSGQGNATLIYQGSLRDGMGRSVSGAGDINGDGFDDVIIGAPNADPNGDLSGASYVVYGRSHVNTEEGVTFGGRFSDILRTETAVTGGGGKDVLFDDSGVSALMGGEGDDVLVITGTDFVRVDGGTGHDLLKFSAIESTLDLTRIGDLRVQSIESIDLGRDHNTLRIDAAEVLRLSESTNTLRVVGGPTDQVQLVGMEWRHGDGVRDNGILYSVYESGNARVEVQRGVGVLGGPIKGVTFAESVSGSGGFIINGLTGANDAGYSVSFVGDVNGDGFDDVVIGAPHDNAGGIDSGAAYVVFGKADGVTVELSDLINGLGGFLIKGEYDDDHAGFAVSGLGDINGDGFDDILVSSPGYDVDDDGELYYDVGSVYVVYGKADGTEVDLVNVGKGQGGMVIDGVLDDTDAGFSVSGAGDVNGDGIADILIGVPVSTAHGEDAGAAYVVFGDPSDEDGVFSLDDLELDLPEDGFAIHGMTPGELAGFSVSAAGDVNGDGLDDVIIGAPSDSLARGAAYVVFGKDSTDMIHLDDIAAGNGGFVIRGDTSVGDKSDRFGTAVAGIGDFNGDGKDDVLIGAPYALGDQSESGMAYIVFGKEDGEAVDLSSISSDGAAIVIQGDEAGGHVGISVSAAGDVNGDGLVDLIIGAPDSSGDVHNGGTAFVVFGREDAATIQMSDIRAGVGGFTILGRGSFDDTGFAVSGGGDVNGDGFADLIVGMPGSDTNADSSGGAVVVFGGNFTGAVTQIGLAGDDALLGTPLHDILYGARGDDTLDGGGGTDLLSGGAGADRFVITDVEGTTTIADFNGDAGDRLDLSDFGIADFATLQTKIRSEGGQAELALDGDTMVILSGLDPDVLQASHVIL